MTEFEKYASLGRGISTNTLDRIIWVGCAIDDDVANIVQAQLLFLSSIDSKADISLYLNTPGGSVSDGLGIYDTMQLSLLMWPPSVPVWPPPWAAFSFAQVPKASAAPCRTQE